MCTMRQILGGMVHSNYQWPVENMLHALKVPTRAVAIALFPFFLLSFIFGHGHNELGPSVKKMAFLLTGSLINPAL